MLTTKYKLAEQILLLTKNTAVVDESDISVQEVMLLIDQNIATIVKNYVGQTEDEIQEIDGQMLYTFKDIEIKQDNSGVYCELPSIPINLPRGRGINAVYNHCKTFIPLGASFKNVLKNVFKGNFEGNIGYYVDQHLLRFEGFSDVLEKETVDVVMVVPISGLEADDKIVVPEDLQDLLVKTIYQIIQAPRDAEDDIIDKQHG